MAGESDEAELADFELWDRFSITVPKEEQSV